MHPAEAFFARREFGVRFSRIALSVYMGQWLSEKIVDFIK
jgi:hypothetical protein